jgi:hypothetical protein
MSVRNAIDQLVLGMDVVVESLLVGEFIDELRTAARARTFLNRLLEGLPENTMETNVFNHYAQEFYRFNGAPQFNNNITHNFRAIIDYIGAMKDFFSSLGVLSSGAAINAMPEEGPDMDGDGEGQENDAPPPTSMARHGRGRSYFPY